MKDNLMIIPQIVIWNLIDSTIFIDEELSMRDGVPRPREGLATDISKRY